MKNSIFLLLTLIVLSCNSESSNTAASEEPPKVDSTKGTVTYAGPDVDMIKGMIAASEKNDWTNLRSYFSDSALAFMNTWPSDTTQARVSIDAVIEEEKVGRKDLENIAYKEPIIEVVTTAAGDSYGHLWARWTAMNKKTGKSIDVPFFASFLIKDGKIQWIWELFDSKKFE